MVQQELRLLAESYPPVERDTLFELAQRYRNQDEREALEVATLAADISIDESVDLRLEPELNPQFWEAFSLQYPNIDVEGLAGAPDERLQDLVNGAKGKYFEVLVRDQLNAGDRVAGIQLEPGQTAVLAESPTQPGWDLRIENDDGSVDEFLQLKASDSMSYIKKALEDYPGIRVIVPSEVDADIDDILSADLSNEDLDSITQEQLTERFEGGIEDYGDQVAEGVFDSIPYFSMVLTGVIEARNVLTGRSTLRESLRRGARRTGKAAVYDSVGTVLGPAGAAVPVIRFAEGRLNRRATFADNLEPRTSELEQLTKPPV